MSVFKGILLGLLVGIVVGWWMAEDAERREFENDAEIQAHIAESERMRTMARLINEL
jgi:hypothetical protein